MGWTEWAVGLLLVFHLSAGHGFLSQWVICAEQDGRIQIEMFQDQFCCLAGTHQSPENATAATCQECSDINLADHCKEFKSRQQSRDFLLQNDLFCATEGAGSISAGLAERTSVLHTDVFLPIAQKILNTFVLLI